MEAFSKNGKISEYVQNKVIWFNFFFFFFEGGWWNRCQRGKIGEGEEHREKEWCSRAGDQMLQLPEVWLNSESTKLRGVKEGIGAVPASKRWKPYCLNPSEVIRFCRGGW